MKQVIAADELANEIEEARAAGKYIAFVPTMGALHEGHLSLVRQARANAEFVVVSIFVNPLQFGPNEDFEKYPRDLTADAELLQSVGADLLWAPTVDVVYPNGGEITKHAGKIGDLYEGASRPGHFDGVLTVVARLFDLVKPDIVFFGAKDAQQVTLIRQMVARDFEQISMYEAPTVREASGLAMSSRNRYLTEHQRQVATGLITALRAGEHDARNGAKPSEVLITVNTELAKVPEAKLDYIALVDSETFESIDDDFTGRARLLIAAKVGETRLIDNLEIKF
jgi:pantoate--beta-alanine ligase